MSKLDDDIGARLTAARQMKGLSREEASKILGQGFSLSAVQAHENGRNALRPNTILRYIQVYDLDCFWLLTGSGDPGRLSDTLKTILSALSKEDRATWISIGERFAAGRPEV